MKFYELESGLEDLRKNQKLDQRTTFKIVVQYRENTTYKLFMVGPCTKNVALYKQKSAYRIKTEILSRRITVKENLYKTDVSNGYFKCQPIVQ